ncbi:MAG: hypothetical protein IJV14_14170 [Lachnospiraceae bacterium]|nr:hypothetical protein [Lachnospiraceae bacterium]
MKKFSYSKTAAVLLTAALVIGNLAGCGMSSGGTNFAEQEESSENTGSSSEDENSGADAAETDTAVNASEDQASDSDGTGSDSAEQAGENGSDDSEDASISGNSAGSSDEQSVSGNSTETADGSVVLEVTPVDEKEELLEKLHSFETDTEHELEAETSIYDQVGDVVPDEVAKEVDPALLQDYIAGNEGSNIAPTLIDDEVMKIAILGDSQFGNFKDYDGMGFLLSQYCRADVYNFAIGGTQAAVALGEGTPTGKVGENVTGVGMAMAVTGQTEIGFLEMYPYVHTLFQICDFDDIDVFVVEYGVNDFFAKVPITNYGTNYPAICSYRESIDFIVKTLRQRYPEAKIVVCAPGYAQFFSNGAYLGDGNMMSNGVGTLMSYADSCINHVQTSYNPNEVTLMDAYYVLGVNGLTAHDYLLDGVHYNRQGREIYAQMLGRIIIRLMGYSIEPGVNPADGAWLATKQ